MPERSAVIYGAGAVGGYLAARLAHERSGLKISLIGRPRVVQAVERGGLRVREGGSWTSVPVPAATSPEGLAQCDLVILTVRAYDVEGAIEDLRALVSPGGLVLAMQNGVGSEERLAQALGRERVLTGTLTISVGMEEPGAVTRYSSRGGMALAPMSNGPVPEWVVEAFRRAGLPTVTVEDYRSLRWSKLLLNLLGAATTAVLDIDMAAMVAKPDIFRIEQLAFREAGRVVDALGIRTVALPGYPAALARLAARLPLPLARRTLGAQLARSRGGRAPSMRMDIDRGRTEMAYLNGAVAAAGAAAGVATPLNGALADLVHEVTVLPERRDALRHNPAELIGFLRSRGIHLWYDSP